MRSALVLGLMVVASRAWAAPSGIGTAAPTDVVAAAADGSWAVLCQARKDTDRNGQLAVRSYPGGTGGDQQQAYFVAGTGPGIELEDVIAEDPSGKRVVVQRKRRLVLLQPPGRELDLTKLGAQSVQFDGTGDRLLYTKRIGKREHIIVRELATGRERVLDPGPGLLYSLSTEGEWVHVQMLARKGQWVVDEDHAPRRCWTGGISDVSSASGTPPVTRLIPIAGGAARKVPDLVGVFGATLVRRTTDGALVGEQPDGTTRELVPSSCGGTVVEIDSTRDSVTVVCKGGGLVEYAAGKARAIGATIAEPSADWVYETGRFHLISGKDGGSIVLDLRTGAKRETGEPQQRHGALGDVSVIQRGEKLVALDGSGERVLGDVARYPARFRAGTSMYIEPLVVDLKTGSLLGRAPAGAGVKAIARDGKLLVGTGGGRWDMTAGPLSWVAPDPP